MSHPVKRVPRHTRDVRHQARLTFLSHLWSRLHMEQEKRPFVAGEENGGNEFILLIRHSPENVAFSPFP
jgi:hypothetical protein